MGQKIAGIAVLVVFAAIVANLVRNPKGTGVIVNGISGLWRSSLQAAGGQAVK